MGLRGGPPREHALATPFGTLEQCRGRALLDPISAGRKHFCHPDPAKREKDLLFAKDSESSIFFLPSNYQTSLGKDNCPDFKSARYGSSSSFADGSGGGLLFTGGFGAAVFAGGDFASAGAACALVDAFLLCAVFSTVRYFRIFSSLFAPIPLIASKSSTLLNAPYDFRIPRILSAVEGPIPGTCCNSAALAEFKLIGCVGGFFLARTVAAQQRISKHESKESIRL